MPSGLDLIQNEVRRFLSGDLSAPILRGYARRMSRRGEIDTFLQSQLYKTLLCRSLEAGMGTLAALATKAAENGETSLNSFETAHTIQASVGPFRLFAPSTGKANHKAVAFAFETETFIAVAEFNGVKSDDAWSKAFLRRLAEMQGGTFDEEAHDRAQAALPPEPPRILGVGVYRVQSQKEAEESIAAAVKGGWSDLKMFSTRRALETDDEAPDGTKVWLSGASDNNDLDQWPRFFAAFSAAIDAYGLREKHDADVAAMAARRYSDDSSHKFDHYAAADDLAERLAQEDRYLPQAGTMAALRLLQAISAESVMQQRLDQILNILALCRKHGHVSKKTEFDHNDLGNFVYTPDSGHPNRDLLVFRDQNCHFAVRIERDGEGNVGGLAVHHEIRPYSDSGKRDTNKQMLAEALDDTDLTAATLLAAFSVENGTVKVVRGPGTEADHVRDWNSFLTDLATGECCLEDEHGKILDDEEGAPSP